MTEERRGPASIGGSSAELHELLTTHGARLLRAAYLLCGNEIEAQDLVQETFLQALKSAERFRGGSALYTWLHGILRNLCYRHFRAQKRFVFDEEAVLEKAQPANAGIGADQDFCAAKLAQGLRQLSPEHREAVVLRYYENLKIHEIAAQTGVSPGTVKSRLFYAIRCLEQTLPPEMNLFAAQGTKKQEMK